jgi:hypothetical protein
MFYSCNVYILLIKGTIASFPNDKRTMLQTMCMSHVVNYVSYNLVFQKNVFIKLAVEALDFTQS